MSRVCEAWDGDRQAVAGQVTGAMVTCMALCGSPQEGRTQLETYRPTGVTLPIVSFTHGASRDMIRQTLEGLGG